MYEITKKEILSESIFLMDVKAPRVARNCYPGQFIIVKMDERGAHPSDHMRLRCCRRHGDDCCAGNWRIHKKNGGI